MTDITYYRRITEQLFETNLLIEGNPGRMFVADIGIGMSTSQEYIVDFECRWQAALPRPAIITRECPGDPCE